MRDETRRALFWYACIPARFIIGLIATFATLRDPNNALFTTLGIAATLVTLGFLTSAIRTALGHKTRGGLGGKVWWNRARWVHIIDWGATAALSFARVRGAGTLLLFDACVGAALGVAHHGFDVTF